MRDHHAPPDDGAPHPGERDKPSTTSASTAMTQTPSSLPVAAGETSSSAIAARARAEVEARFLFAAKFPRDFNTARRRILDACARPAFAGKARYSKPVGGKQITGLSIRFAEQARCDWGNMEVTAMIVFDDDERRIYRVQGTDLETNATDGVDVMIEKFVERLNPAKGSEIISQRINTRGVMTYRVVATEDDLLVKVNNQVAKARRNVILTILPADIKEEAEALILATQRNADAEDPAGARKKLIDAFWAVGVTPEQITSLLGHPIEQINPAELTLLRTYYVTLSDGEGTWTEIVEAHSAGTKKPTESTATTGAATEAKGTGGLRERVAAAKTSAAPAAAKTDPDPGVCEFCGANVKKGEPHKPNCETLR